MAILVTGGAGYIGSHVVKALWYKGRKIVVVDRFSPEKSKAILKWARFYKGDFGDASLLEKIFSENEIDAVMHFAAYIRVDESMEKPLMYFENNVAKTIVLLKEMQRHNVKRFVFSSTCAIYGTPKYLPLDENHPLNPESVYGMTKMMVEDILKSLSAAEKLRFVSLRYFNAAGADWKSGIGYYKKLHLIPKILDVVLGKEPELKVFGTDYDTRDGTCIRDYIHVLDLADAHVLALEYLENGGRSDFFNLGSGKGYTVKEVIKAVEEVCGKKIPFVEAGRRQGDVSALFADNKKAKAVLGWNPKRELKEIISSAWEWHRRCFA